MNSYICKRLSYSRHIHGTETFDASDDKEACRITIALADEGNWLDYELWQAQRQVQCGLRAIRPDKNGVLTELKDSW